MMVDVRMDWGGAVGLGTKRLFLFVGHPKE